MTIDSLMVTLAAFGAAFMTVALLADLLGLRITTAMAVGLAAWCWIAAGNLAFAPHEYRSVVSIAPQAEPTGAKWVLRIRPEAAGVPSLKYYERNN